MLKFRKRRKQIIILYLGTQKKIIKKIKENRAEKIEIETYEKDRA